MKATTFKAALLAGSLGLIAGSASGQGLSDPVGYYTKTFKGGSDTSLGLGLLRPEFGSVTISGIAGAVVTIGETLNASELDPAGGTTAGAVNLMYQGDIPGNTYMLLITAGDKVGGYYPIATNGVGDITIDLLGDTLVSADATSGKIIPMWDLNTIFPAGTGLNPTTTPGSINGSIVFFNDLASAGINLSFPLEYTYVGVGNPTFDGFYASNASITDPSQKINVVVFPDEYLVVRNEGALPDSTLTVTGDVLVDSVRITVTNQGDPSGQDVPVGIPYPVDLTLNALGLASFPESDAFKNSSNPAFEGDILFIYDDVTAALNKSFTPSYVFFEGEQFTTDPADNNWFDATLSPGPGQGVGDTATVPGNTGVKIFKAAGAASMGDWVFTSPYTP